MIKAIRSLSNENDTGSENIAKKMNTRSFKLKRVYLDYLNLSNVGDFSWIWILRDFIWLQKGIRRRVFKSFMKRRIRRFHFVKWTSTKWAKKRDARVELLFCSALYQLYLYVVVVAVAVVAYSP